MKIVFSDARKIQQFANIFANLKNFTDNVCIYFKQDGIYIQCMDDSHCCLFECKLYMTWFHSYEYDEANDQACVGVNIVMLNKVLNTWNDTQTMAIIVENGSDKISINFEKGENNNIHFNKFFQLSLVNIENELMDVKLFETIVDLTIESKIFCALMGQLIIFNETLTLTFNEENIECLSSGMDGSLKASISVNDVKEYAIPESTVLTQSYSLRYVQLMCQFNKLSNEMVMGFSSDMPMIMKYSLSENDKTESFVRIHLAPKITEEE